LPEEQKRAFVTLLNEGSRLKNEGTTTPGYQASIPADLADKLVGSNVFRAAVNLNGKKLFIFAEGDLSDAQGPQLASNTDTMGFSNRVIMLDRRTHGALINQVSQRFRISASELTPCLLVNAQLDQVVLATQHRAAGGQGFDLDQVHNTLGIFEYAEGGIPFKYSISELVLKDGRRILPHSKKQNRASGNSLEQRLSVGPSSSSNQKLPSPSGS
jgi:hypothetical protein